MSVKKCVSRKNSKAAAAAVEMNKKKEQVPGAKRRKYSNCFSFKEISIDVGEGSSLADMDSNELKTKIIRWAKAVAAYARQVSSQIKIRSRPRSNKSDSYGRYATSSSSSSSEHNLPYSEVS